jgi:hypothetical protein
MLLYLASNSRPDIDYAVHQAACFNHCAHQSHEVAVKRIARYLKGTRDKGLIFNPNSELLLELYADADFAGLWGSEDKDYPICGTMKSLTFITNELYIVLLNDKIFLLIYLDIF